MHKSWEFGILQISLNCTWVAYNCSWNLNGYYILNCLNTLKLGCKMKFWMMIMMMCMHYMRTFKNKPKAHFLVTVFFLHESNRFNRRSFSRYLRNFYVTGTFYIFFCTICKIATKTIKKKKTSYIFNIILNACNDTLVSILQSVFFLFI